MTEKSWPSINLLNLEDSALAEKFRQLDAFENLPAKDIDYIMYALDGLIKAAKLKAI